jgi:KamA family protein
VEEVILTGGDPWMLSDDRLRALVDGLASASPAIKRLRFHSRMPVTLPMRITEGLVAAISRPGRFQTVVVTHFNHLRELSAEARAAIRLLKGAGFLVLNQSVLLKGVNDSAEALRALFLALGNEGVLPYYLHHCDLVAGGEFFLVRWNGSTWSSMVTSKQSDMRRRNHRPRRPRTAWHLSAPPVGWHVLTRKVQVSATAAD